MIVKLDVAILWEEMVYPTDMHSKPYVRYRRGEYAHENCAMDEPDIPF